MSVMRVAHPLSKATPASESNRPAWKWGTTAAGSDPSDRISRRGGVGDKVEAGEGGALAVEVGRERLLAELELVGQRGQRAGEEVGPDAGREHAARVARVGDGFGEGPVDARKPRRFRGGVA